MGALGRSTSLHNLLQALLLSYTSLVSSLLAPPPWLDPTAAVEPTLSEKWVDHIRLICINMHYLVNQLRPLQVRESRIGSYAIVDSTFAFNL